MPFACGSYLSVDECQTEFSRVPKVHVLEELTTSVRVDPPDSVEVGLRNR